MYDVVALGEALVDFTHYGENEAGNALFERIPGGAPVNVLATCAELGLSCAFIGKVGADANGDFFRSAMNVRGIDVSGMSNTDDAHTTMAFVKLIKGERQLSFVRKPGADSFLTAQEVNLEMLNGSKIFHFGSVSLTDEPSRSATIRTARAAKAAGAIISYDPNYRADLWRSVEEASARMKGATFLVDIIKLSLQEMVMMTGKRVPEEAAEILLGKGPTCVIITLGDQGALIFTNDGNAKKAPFPCNMLDPTGHGDIFFGSFLYRLAASKKPLADHNLTELEGYVSFANAAASISMERRGGMTSVPTLSEIYERLG